MPVGEQQKIVVPSGDRGFPNVRAALDFLFVECFDEPAWADCAHLSLINEDRRYDSRDIKELARQANILPKFEERR